ncbi:MAG: hypothetical protein LAP39_14400 [Acidobacteriia bacterium]|nr:hypothetical protein [Terriglobia bacterium]
MSRIVRHEFMGSWIYFWLFCISGFLLPIAILYLINGTIRVEVELEDPEQFVEDFRSGKLRGS